MKIYTRLVLDQDSNVLEQESYEYDGPVAECGGGGGRTSAPPQQQVTSTATNPWGPQQPYLERGFKAAEEQFLSDRPKYFPGSTVVPFQPEETAAMDIKRAQATSPYSLPNLATAHVAQTMGGEYLRADNPVYQQALQGVTGAVRPTIDTQFAQSGRFGSPIHAEALGRGITAGMMPYTMAERGRQFAAAQKVPQMSQMSPELLADVGGAQRAMKTAELGEAMQRHAFEENLPQAKLAQYMAGVGGPYGSAGITTRTTPQTVNPLASWLGMAATAASVGKDIWGTGGPYERNPGGSKGPGTGTPDIS